MTKREQVVEQCKAVAYLARTIAQVHSETVEIWAAPEFQPTQEDGLLDVVGERTASFMEQLGDMLNAMDANDEQDQWLEPVFAEAQRLWPVARSMR